MALAFAGTAPFGAAILAGLINPPDGIPPRGVALVISQPDRPKGRGRTLAPTPVASVAHEHNLPLVQPKQIAETDAALREAGVDTIIVAAFGQMIREPMLSDYLMLNVHGSLLPAYRGAAPVERAIMDGCTETGVCIMQMDAGLDTGPVALRATTPIGPNDDAGEIFARCQDLGVRLLHNALQLHDSADLHFTPQGDGATYAHKIVAADRQLNVATSTLYAHNQVRALSPHIGAFIMLGETRLGIWRTQPVHELPAPFDAAMCTPGVVVHDAQRLVVGTTDGALDVLELQPPGKRRMAANEWLRGLREPLPSAAVAPA